MENMKIYTKTGDRGKTSLMGGKRVLKSDIRVEAYGTVDELNSMVGVVLSHLSDEYTELRTLLLIIQHDLFAIGSYLSDPSAKAIKGISETITKCERMIDKQTQQLPALRNFILPGGDVAGSSLHHARTVCRRAERRVIALAREHDVDASVISYLNRLSDLLFSSARFVNHQERHEETIWKK